MLVTKSGSGGFSDKRKRSAGITTIFFWPFKGSAVAPSFVSSICPRLRPCQNIISLPFSLSLLLLLLTTHCTPVVAHHHPMDVPSLHSIRLPYTPTHPSTAFLVVGVAAKQDDERTDRHSVFLIRSVGLKMNWNGHRGRRRRSASCSAVVLIQWCNGSSTSMPRRVEKIWN